MEAHPPRAGAQGVVVDDVGHHLPALKVVPSLAMLLKVALLADGRMAGMRGRRHATALASPQP